MIHILDIDDEPGLLEIGKLFLERIKDINVETINSATLGLDKLDMARYDVLESDCQMPAHGRNRILIMGASGKR